MPSCAPSAACARPPEQTAQAPRRKGMSQVDMAYDILKRARSPLHVSVIIERIQQAFARHRRSRKPGLLADQEGRPRATASPAPTKTLSPCSRRPSDGPPPLLRKPSSSSPQGWRSVFTQRRLLLPRPAPGPGRLAGAGPRHALAHPVDQWPRAMQLVGRLLPAFARQVGPAGIVCARCSKRPCAIVPAAWSAWRSMTPGCAKPAAPSPRPLITATRSRPPSMLI